jgi:hypothetical protein
LERTDVIRRVATLWSKLLAAIAMAGALTGTLVSASVQADQLAAAAGSTASTRRILGVHRILGTPESIAPQLGGSKLLYHGGPVEHTNKVYAIYWIPAGYTVSTNYVSLINRFFGDVAADSGKTTNVYYSDTQYTDTTGAVQYNSTFAGSVTDTNPLPASGCTDTATSVCLTDVQIQSEIQNVVAAQGWVANPTTEFIMFTAKGIGGCFDSTNTDKCAWKFGVLQGTSGHRYSQTINGNHYYLQMEWSNKSIRCVQQGA